MKNRLLHSILFVFIGLMSSYAQGYFNDWIDYDKEYFRVAVTEDGIQRIAYDVLVSNGFPADEIDPRWIQLFYKGQEQYIYIEGEGSSGIFDPNGYIEFYGKRNRGDLDSLLYENPEDHVNPDHSLYTDTAVYFLTWNNSTSNLRYSTETDSDFASYTGNQSEYCMVNRRTNYTGEYYWASTRCVYTEGEGWFDATVITEDYPRTKTITTPEVFTGGADANIELAVVGAPSNDVVSFVPHHLKVEYFGTTQVDEIYEGYEFVRSVKSFPASQLSEDISFTFSSNDTEVPLVTDRNVISYIQVDYPHTFNFEGASAFEFELPAGSGGKNLLEISDLTTSTGTALLYDIDQKLRIPLTNQGGVLKALVPENGSSRHCMAIGGNDGVISISSLEPVSTNNTFTDYLSRNPDADYLIITHESLQEAAEAYRDYRISQGYNADVFLVGQLYDQFACGVKKNPLALRNFIHYLYNENSTTPKYLFLIGKSIHSRMYRNDGAFWEWCLVPSMGNPSSDNLLTAGLEDSYFEPLVPTGRLSAKDASEVDEYLAKIAAYESNPTGEWMKNVLHFGGGSNSSEQSTFSTYLHNYEMIVEDTLFGGYVSTFLKNSSDPIQITVSDSVRDLINNGVTLMTFFGHAASSGFDQNIDDPQNYNNEQRYPFILANSCFAGDIHLPYSQSTSEDWTIIPDKGAIGFLASVGEGIPSYLNQFSDRFYRNMTYKNYGAPVGDLIQNSIQQAQQYSLEDYRLELTCHEFTLHGDPALALNSMPNPDLLINNDEVILVPEEISTTIDSFNVDFVVTNAGMATADTFLVHVSRTFPDGSISEYDIALPGCLYKDSLSLKLPVNVSKGPGINYLSLQADFYDDIEEMSETNNDANLQFLITSGEVYPVYPYEFAIIPNSQFVFKASTGDPFADAANYSFEVDTSDTYNSNLGAPLYQANINSEAGIISWDPPFSAEEDRVYYWRVAKEHSNPDSMRWNESSFVHIPGKEGWSQAHFYQFKEDDFDFIDFNRENRSFDFIETPKELHCHNISDVWSEVFFDVRFTIDGAVNNGDGDFSCCGSFDAMMVAVIDPVTLKAWPSNINDYGHRNYPQCQPPPSDPDYFFVFTSTSESQLQDMNSLLLSIPDGYHVLVYSWENGHFEEWEENIYNSMESLGSTHIRDITNDLAYIFYCQKGDPSSADEVWGEDEIDLYVDLYSKYFFGTIVSPPIGPTDEWKELHWNQEDIDIQQYDSTFMGIAAYDIITRETTPLDTLLPDEYDIMNLGDEIDAANYPYLQFTFWSRDDSTKTPGQLKKWQLMNNGIPETAINPQEGYHLYADTLMRGDMLEFALATENISTHDMDSLLVKYWIQNAENEVIPLETKRLGPHPAGDVIIDTIEYNTGNLSGVNSIWVEYNPVNEGTGTYDQLEQYHFNNIAQKLFFVQGDNANPLLDVSFDGVHILDGDIVSASPEILITLNDDNEYIPLNDTSLFRIYLANMETGVEERIYFIDSLGREVLEWTPGSLPDNKFRILYHPEFTEDGKYQLRVQATDASGNESGEYDYTISFEVITESSITHVLNYPNPFSTSTRFVFELTGSQVPDEIRIEIYTITGKLVKVIDQSMLGSIHIGRNITDYAWDGTDMYGDRLANGVYFYRVRAKINGSDMEHRNTDADTYFKKEIGKMYLLR